MISFSRALAPTLGLVLLVATPARADEVTVWRDGEAVSALDIDQVPENDLAVLDLGEGWVPPIFAPHESFVPTFVALAQGRFDDVEDEDLARRARLDRYLESYGIPPTLGVLRDRLRDRLGQPCRADLEAIAAFGGSDVDEDDVSAWEGAAVPRAEQFVQQLLVREDAFGVADLRQVHLTPYERAWLGRALPLTVWRQGLAAVRERLACEGIIRGRIEGHDFDPRTRAALASFERRHRIYARGRMSGETLAALRLSPSELARRDVLRALTERARLDWGILADGTAAPDRLGPIREGLVRAFGLQTPESTLAWLESLPLDDLAPHRVAVQAPTPAPHEVGVLELRVEIDRGDQNYDPPEEARAVRVERRPTLTLFALLGEEWVPLVKWPTTVGGWRLERERGRDVWKYKESPAGPGVWQQIHAAPVWLPPASTPDADLLLERHVEETGEITTELKRTLLGPGYASAFGLASAIHRPLLPNGQLGEDEGIRTHGSVDYTSVWRRASHGCHRLQNHRAVALLSFILKHRNHRRAGARALRYERTVRVGETSLTLEVPRSGYVYVLDPPVPFEVLPGRVVGRVQRPPRQSVPTN
ncbi:MAG: hypothetical protein CMN30_15330 [Sandaracinus sp.]|nr:hypothetical protein [Sandaracinus sp.]